MVEARLAEAAEVIRRLPSVRVPGYFNTWPPMIVEFADQVGQQAGPMQLPPPSPAAISRMEEALAWLRWLNAEHAKLIWARAERTPWKLICWRFGIARAHRASTLAVRAQPDRVSAQRTKGASERVASPFRSLGVSSLAVLGLL